MSNKEMVVLSTKTKPSLHAPSVGRLLGTSLRVLVLSILLGAGFFGIDRLFMFLMSYVFGA